MSARGSRAALFPRTARGCRAAVACGAAVGLVALVACTPELPMLARGEPDRARAITVPRPPPPARVDVVPDPPLELRSPCWADGSWTRGARDWEWVGGRWVACDAGSEYVPATLFRTPSGELRFVPSEIRSVRPSTARSPEQKAAPSP
jgi:hypothetical protein